MLQWTLQGLATCLKLIVMVDQELISDITKPQIQSVNTFSNEPTSPIT